MSGKNKTLAQQLSELDKILEWFDGSDIDLDEALKKFEQGTRLAEDIKKQISTLKNKIEVLKGEMQE